MANSKALNTWTHDSELHPGAFTAANQLKITSWFITYLRGPKLLTVPG